MNSIYPPEPRSEPPEDMACPECGGCGREYYGAEDKWGSLQCSACHGTGSATPSPEEQQRNADEAQLDNERLREDA